MREWFRRLRHLARQAREEADLREELETHRALRQHQLERHGVSADEAAAVSRRMLGNVTLAREDVRDVWMVRWIDHLRQDLRVGSRMLLKHQGLTASAVISLALGIGANSAVFSVVSPIVLDPLPYRDPSRLVMIWSVDPKRPDANQRATGPEYLAWQRHATLFEAMGTEGQNPRDLGADDAGAPAERVSVQRLQSSLFTVLGLHPAMGRPFRPDEERVGAPAAVALLSDRLWERRFGRNPNIMNATIRLDGIPTTIIGVMPASFSYLSNGDIDLFTPFAFNAAQVRGSGRGYAIAARLKPGVTIAQAQAEMDAIVAQVEPDLPTPSRGWRTRVQPLHDALYGNVAPNLLLLQGIVGLVLLIACANVAGLLLARSTGRHTEIAMRAAIGAGRTRIVHQLLTESVLLATVGGLASLGVAWAMLKLIVAMGPSWLPQLRDATIDRHALAFTAVTSIATGLAFGILPAWHTSRPDLVESLKRSTKGTTGGTDRQRLRSGLVAVQIALAFVLLVGSGLLINSFLRLKTNELGGNPHDVVTFTLTFPNQGNRNFQPIGTYRGFPHIEISPTVLLTNDRVLEGLRRLPGVQLAAGSSSVPFAGDQSTMPFNIDGRSASANEDLRQATSADYHIVTPGFFSTMGVPMVAGRDFDDRDTTASPWAVVINEAMAKAFWPTENPIGRRLTVDIVPDEQPREVIGIVKDFRSNPYQHAFAPMMFALHRQQPPHTTGPAGTGMRNKMSFVVRTAGDVPAVVAGIRRMMTDLDRDRPITEVRRLDDDIAALLFSYRDTMTVIGFFAGLATLLAAVGVYGIMSHSVGQRTREIGIRMALGADRSDVRWLVMRHVGVVVAIGLVAGFGGALALTRLIARMLWGVTPTDLMTFIGVSLIMALVGLLAGWIPTRRALEVAPTVALRAE